MKSTRKQTTKKAAQKFSKRTGRPITKASKFDSGDAEPIADAAGDIGNVAHAFFFNSQQLPLFLRNSIEGQIKRAAARLNMPNPYDTDDDRTAFQQTVDLFVAAGDELFLDERQKDEDTPEQAARNFVRFMESKPKHDFITDALVDAVAEAAHAHNTTPPDYSEPESEQIRIMSDLFAVVPETFSLRKERNDLRAFGHHLAETIRLARDLDEVPTFFYNDLAHAWNEFQNRMESATRVNDSEAFIQLALEAYRQEVEARTQRGGAK